ncbi:hypothetical protein BDV29DRAFT_163997 [Aspergillus leporis]|uniref:Secreted protein n=1 Tax=Aspergillus leporis TaxID=41062 RepID=A0A5N5XFR3_9EURO|nr:hypothetical protein BDV29DRAFT_163997 [Aspergillus leporis]
MSFFILRAWVTVTVASCSRDPYRFNYLVCNRSCFQFKLSGYRWKNQLASELSARSTPRESYESYAEERDNVIAPTGCRSISV